MKNSIIRIVTFIIKLYNKLIHKYNEDFFIQITQYNVDIEEFKKNYFSNDKTTLILEKYRNLFNEISDKKFTKKKFSKFFKEYQTIESCVKTWNKKYVESELIKMDEYFSDIDGKNLDEQQRKSIIVDEENNLILAGAGCGKTLTIAAKVKYLTEHKKISTDEILLISFTTKAAQEMTERISKLLGKEMVAKTFHSLGLNIISNTRRERPDIADEDTLRKIIKNYFINEIISNKEQINNIINYFAYYFHIPFDYEKYENAGQRYEREKAIDLKSMKSKYENKNISDDLEINKKINELKVTKCSLKGEQLKSIEEVIIANFLFLNGIEYEYEKAYIFDYENEKDKIEKKKYCPDFYLPVYEIWIEHFGITEDYKTPWLSPIEEKKYIDGVNWKRSLHKSKKTKLLETYSYYNKNGILLKKLEEKLRAEKVVFEIFNYEKVYKYFFLDNENKLYEEFQKLIITFINLFKSNGFDEKHFQVLIEEENENIFLKKRTNLFINIVKPIFHEYKTYLDSSKLIDFNDMINEATSIVKNNSLNTFPFKYIIVDEYQDISHSRFKLIYEIREKTKAKILCVGDDWQSIYRFTGSDISLFTDFEKNFGYSEVLKIEKTYRNSQSLIDIAGKYIMKNNKQLKKQLVSGKENIPYPIKIYTYENFIFAFNKAIESIVALEGKEVYVLGRNNYDIKIFEFSDSINCYYKVIEVKSKTETIKTIKSIKYPKLKITYITTHKSKGLEAENVILINLENKKNGFPNQILDDPVLSLVLTSKEDFEFCEERRLFYVALTRTKYNTFILAPYMKESLFVTELCKDFSIISERILENPGEIDILKINKKSHLNCPVCGEGFLTIREKGNKQFLGCTNYPSCDKTYNTIEIVKNEVRCNICGDYMVKRKSQYGEFYGCTNYPDYCKNTVSLSTKVSPTMN